MFNVFIEGINGKIKGLRKLKGNGVYSIQSYGGKNLKESLEFFLKEKVNLSGKY